MALVRNWDGEDSKYIERDEQPAALSVCAGVCVWQITNELLLEKRPVFVS